MPIYPTSWNIKFTDTRADLATRDLFFVPQHAELRAILFGSPEEHGAVFVLFWLDSAKVSALAVGRVHVGNDAVIDLNSHTIFGQDGGVVFFP